MGLYIDMEMPQNCQSCNFYNGLGCEATGRMFSLFYNVATRRSDCPLIEVPEPHGDLIDADKLKETLDYYISEAGWSGEINKALSWVKDEFIDSEQAVIPASEEGET